MHETGPKIIEGLRQAVAGNFASVTIEGQTWVPLRGGSLVAQLSEAHAEIRRLRTALETIAGSASDKLQAAQAKGALANIGSTS